MRQIISLITGFVVLNAIALFGNVIFIPGNIKIFAANFIGGICIGYISRKHGVVNGIVVSVISLLGTITFLIFISYRASGGGFFFPKFDTIYLEYFAVLFGPIGGYLGEKISRRKYAKKDRKGD